MSASSSPSDRELTASRVIAQPIARVFAAHRDPAVLAQWWGPNGFRNTFEVFEFRTGGRWIFVMHGPDGTNYKNESVFEEIVEPTRVVVHHVCWPIFHLYIDLKDRGDGKTLVTWRQRFDSEKDFEKVRAMCETANQENFDRLEAALKTM